MAMQSYRKNGILGYGDDALAPDVKDGMWADCPLLSIAQDPSIAHEYYNHFHDYTAADWTITTTEGGGGAATEAITDELGGVLLITNDNLDDDSDEFQKVGEAFSLVPGKPLWIEGGFKVNDATQSDFLFGLCMTDTTLIDGLQDGIWFQKDDGDANIDRHCDKDNTDTTADTNIDMADGTWIRLGMKFLADGATVEYWINGVRVGSSTTNIPDDELLRISFGIQDGEAVAKTLSVDYIRAVQILGRY